MFQTEHAQGDPMASVSKVTGSRDRACAGTVIASKNQHSRSSGIVGKKSNGGFCDGPPPAFDVMRSSVKLNSATAICSTSSVCNGLTVGQLRLVVVRRREAPETPG